ncbi:hypothetical protein DXG01_015623 [Tephrocybe rancida]|nr:hypothetical protein DXG01_015623 [Tephrocybe rancida]
MAQGLTIGTPQQGQRIPLERPFTVQVIKNVSLNYSIGLINALTKNILQSHIISSIEVAITIGIVPCPESSGCPDPSAVGDVLYQGPYNPQPQGAAGNFQNFTVTIPFNEDLIGNSLLTVNRFFLIGAQNGAVLQSFGVEVETFPL